MRRHGDKWDRWILPLAACTEANTRTSYSECDPHGVSRTKTTKWYFPRAGDPSKPADCAPDGSLVGTEEIRCPYLPPASPLGVATHIVVALCSLAVAFCLVWVLAVADLPKPLARCVCSPARGLCLPPSRPAPLTRRTHTHSPAAAWGGY